MFEPAEVMDALGRCDKRGVRGVLVPSTGPEDFQTVLNLGEDFPDRIVTSIGVHPHEASCLDGDVKRRIEAGLQSSSVVAIGEIGLDYHYMNSPREDQLKSLEWQLDLAIEAEYPVILHNRESWEDLERVLAVRNPGLRGVCHSFTEGPAEAGRVVELGLLVGISGMVTFKQADNIREMARTVSGESLLVETDSPFLAPVPHRGKRNEPSYVVLVGECLAGLLGIESAEFARLTSDNFARVFAPKW
jgi:TatD DNase family protein